MCSLNHSNLCGRLPLPGVYDRKITEIARTTHDGHNSSRALHGYIHRRGKTLQVPITSVPTRFKLPRKRKVIGGPWPVLHLKDWILTCFKHFAGFFFLAGETIQTWEKAQGHFTRFWDRYKKAFGVDVAHPEATIPMYIHGDEGRGLAKRPILVISFQPLMAWGGPDLVNSHKSLDWSKMKL